MTELLGINSKVRVESLTNELKIIEWKSWLTDLHNKVEIWNYAMVKVQYSCSFSYIFFIIIIIKWKVLIENVWMMNVNSIMVVYKYAEDFILMIFSHSNFCNKMKRLKANFWMMNKDNKVGV